MSDIKQMLKALVDTTDEKNKEKSSYDTSDDTEKTNESDGGLFDGIDVDMLLKIGDIISKLNESDKNTELLLAVKPHLRKENREKIDTAVKLFRIISVIPYLRESGLTDNLF